MSTKYDYQPTDAELTEVRVIAENSARYYGAQAHEMDEVAQRTLIKVWQWCLRWASYIRKSTKHNHLDPVRTNRRNKCLRRLPSTLVGQRPVNEQLAVLNGINQPTLSPTLRVVYLGPSMNLAAAVAYQNARHRHAERTRTWIASSAPKQGFTTMRTAFQATLSGCPRLVTVGCHLRRVLWLAVLALDRSATSATPWLEPSNLTGRTPVGIGCALLGRCDHRHERWPNPRTNSTRSVTVPQRTTQVGWLVSKSALTQIVANVRRGTAPAVHTRALALN